MHVETRNKLLTEPPGPRRAFLALRACGANQALVAELENCNRAVVSRVINGRNTTALHARLRAALARVTGMPESWLFAHASQPPAQQHTQAA